MTTTMSPAARDHAEWALLDELVDCLENAQEAAEALRDHREWRWPEADLTMTLGFVVATIEALDAIVAQEDES